MTADSPALDSPVIPIEVDGQMRLFSPELSDEQVREIFAGVRLRGDREGLFAETGEPISNWP